MKKARIVLSLLVLCVVTAGILSFKATRYNTSPIWRYTTALSTFGTLYTTDVIFCTAHGATRYLTGTGDPITTVTMSIGPASGNVTLRRVGGGGTIIIGNQPCGLIETYTTAAM